jgi:hypothetical protein
VVKVKKNRNLAGRMENLAQIQKNMLMLNLRLLNCCDVVYNLLLKKNNQCQAQAMVVYTCTSSKENYREYGEKKKKVYPMSDPESEPPWSRLENQSSQPRALTRVNSSKEKKKEP